MHIFENRSDNGPDFVVCECARCITKHKFLWTGALLYNMHTSNVHMGTESERWRNLVYVLYTSLYVMPISVKVCICACIQFEEIESVRKRGQRCFEIGVSVQIEIATSSAVAAAAALVVVCEWSQNIMDTYSNNHYDLIVCQTLKKKKTFWWQWKLAHGKTLFFPILSFSLS